ncbi:MAG: NAD-dependent epimerase/dehydratase family protein [Geminicoccaceae bacterium]|nr:NAD-dependent epimerase/dehydratase family protein [Geminicoccaceae bacterium]
MSAGLGVVEWFRPGDHSRVEASLERLRRLGCSRLRTHLSWADYHAEGGRDWYDWLLPRLAGEVELLPCLHYTPPSLSETGAVAGPPRDLKAFADFLDHVVERHGRHFAAVELWNEPNNLLDWDWRVDTDWSKFATMVGAAAHWGRRLGKQVVLGGPCPADMNWLELMGRRGVLGEIDALGLHGFPGTWDSEAAGWPGWNSLAEEALAVLDRHNPAVELWVTEAGYATWRHDEALQARAFLELHRGPFARVYWYMLQDLADEVAVQEGPRFDERHYHMGLFDKAGRPKLLARLLAEGGPAKVAEVIERAPPAPAIVGTRPVLVTGGAGFIGSNLADRLAAEGEHVLVLDSLARPGVERNLAWLEQRHRRHVSSALVDLRDRDGVAAAAADAAAVFHMAAQTAVTTSLVDPFGDFDVNLAGTINLLEAVRRRPVPVIMASTNKVYGDLGNVELIREGERWLPRDPRLRCHGIDETRALSFHTPYGCSKGAADQYMLDYARSFGVPTAVLRMSCICGPRQLGTEDQGWVAHFLIRALEGRPITIFGDGRQVRDVLFVDDAVAAYLGLWRAIDRIAGRAFNLGGGAANAVSLRQVLRAIGELAGAEVEVGYGDWRPGDQRWYVSDTRSLSRAIDLPRPLGWRSGLERLARWLRTDGRDAEVLASPVAEVV